MNLHYPLATSTWDDAEISAMQEVIQSGHFTMGEKVREFESRFAAHFGSKYAVMSNSGSSANLLALAAVRYSSFQPSPEKIEFIVPAVSWSTTYYPISQLGFRLKFVDIDPLTLNLDVERVREAITSKTAGILAVNLLGNPASLKELQVLACQEGLLLLEDNCESMGATLNNKAAGTFGLIGTFSSFFSHHISTMEGGMCLTDSEELAQVMTSLRAHGWTRELPDENHVFNKTGEKFDDLFRFVLPGYNLRPLEISGAIGVKQLEKLPNLVLERRRNAAVWLDSMSGVRGFRTQEENGSSSWFGFSVVLEGPLKGHRTSLVQLLSAKGIECRPIVAGNFTRNPVLEHLNYASFTDFPNADELHTDGLFIGNHHMDLSEDIREIAKVLSEFSERVLAESSLE